MAKIDEIRNKEQKILDELSVVDRHLRALKDKTEELENKKEQLMNELQKVEEERIKHRHEVIV